MQMRELLIPSLFTAATVVAAIVAPLIACAVGSELPPDSDTEPAAVSASTASSSGSSEETVSTGAAPESEETGTPEPDDLAALVGSIDATDLRWRRDIRLDCNSSARVICAQIYGSIAEESHDRYIFVTAPFPGFELGGYAGAVELCGVSAVSASLPGQYAPVLGSPDIVPALWPELGYGEDGGALDLPGAGFYVLPSPLVEGGVQGVNSDPDAAAARVGRNLAGTLLTPINRAAAGRPVGVEENRAVWSALGDELWLDIDDIDLDKYTPEEQRYLALSRTCLDWGAW
mgnify:CR=1 FL=1